MCSGVHYKLEVSQSIRTGLTVAAHAQSETLLQPAVLAAVAIGPIDQAVSLPRAGVHGVVLLAASEETLDEKRTTHVLAFQISVGRRRNFFFFFLIVGCDPGVMNVIWHKRGTHLAAFAGDDTIMDARRFVPADFTGYHFYLSWREKKKGLLI